MKKWIFLIWVFYLILSFASVSFAQQEHKYKHQHKHQNTHGYDGKGDDGIFDPGGWGHKPSTEDISGSGQVEEPPMETIEGIEGETSDKKHGEGLKHQEHWNDADNPANMAPHGNAYGFHEHHGQGAPKSATGDIGNPTGPQSGSGGSYGGSGPKGGKGGKKGGGGNTSKTKKGPKQGN